MPLTPEEQAELASLSGGQQAQKPSGLSPEEQAELHQLSGGSEPGIMSKIGNALSDVYKMKTDSDYNIGQGVSEGLTLGNAKLPDAPGIAKDNVSQGFGRLLGTLTTGGVAGKAAGAIAPAAEGVMGALGRIGTNAASGAAQGMAAKPEGEDTLENRAANGVIPGIAGAGMSAVGEAAGPLKRFLGKMVGLRYPFQQDAYLDDPKNVSRMAKEFETKQFTPQTSDDVVDAMQQSRRNIKADGMGKAAKVRELLDGKKITVDPTEYSDVPGAEKLLSGHGEYSPLEPELKLGKPDVQNVHLNNRYEPLKVPVSEPQRSFIKTDEVKYPSSSIDLDANDANDLKRSAQGAARYRPGNVNDPVQEARAQAMGAKASSLRSALESAEPDIKPLNDSMQKGMYLQEDIRRGLKKPIAYVSSDSADRVADLSRMEDVGGGGLRDMGSKVSAAKALLNHSPSSFLKNAAEATKESIGLPALRAAHAVQQNATPAANSLAALLAELQAKEKN